MAKERAPCHGEGPLRALCSNEVSHAQNRERTPQPRGKSALGLHPTCWGETKYIRVSQYCVFASCGLFAAEPVIITSHVVR